MGAPPAEVSVASSAHTVAPPRKESPDREPPRAPRPPPSGAARSPLWGFLALPVWPAILAVPLALAGDNRCATLLPGYLHAPLAPGWPAPLGLCLGLLAVALGQVAVVLYHYLHLKGCFGPARPIQSEGARPSVFSDALRSHVAQPEGFALVGGWLVLTWMGSVLPASYYSFEGGIEWGKVAACLLLQDLVQFLLHLAEHKINPVVYQYSHKPHHRFVNPILFDAFDGSLLDTAVMILVPLTLTTQAIHCNVWSYMAFGSLYAAWLTLIHSEYAHPWDRAFRRLGLGTAADHHVHHKTFLYNYGHLFLYWDRLFGSYKSPADVRTFNKDV